MTWFAFRGYGTVDLAGAQEKLAVAWGFHGYNTEAMANRNPNSVNPLQKAIVNTLEADYHLAQQAGSQPGGPNSNLANPKSALGGLGSAAAANLGGLGAIGDFFNRLTEKNTWLRVGEVVAGLLLLYIGLKAVTTGTPVGDAAKSVTKPVKAVASATPPGRAFRVEREARRVVGAKKHSAAVAKRVARKAANP